MSKDLSALCLACGLCCGGGLFTFAPLEGDEPERLQALGVALKRRRKVEVLPLPCARLEGKCCTIYEDRPVACRKFVCRLGQQLVAKEQSFDDALATVTRAQAFVAQVKQAFAVPDGEPTMHTARVALGDPMAKPSLEAMELLKEADRFLRDAFIGV